MCVWERQWLGSFAFFLGPTPVVAIPLSRAVLVLFILFLDSGLRSRVQHGTHHTTKSTAGSLITTASSRRSMAPVYLNRAHSCCGERETGSSLDHERG